MSLFTQLQTLLTATPLLWVSESDYPVEAVTISAKTDLSGYQSERAAPLLMNQANTDIDHYNTWADIDLLLAKREYMAYRKPTGAPCEYELLILVRTGWLCPVYTGIRTKLIQT